jgi:uncharacterized protein (DUF885 family)
LNTTWKRIAAAAACAAVFGLGGCQSTEARKTAESAKFKSIVEDFTLETLKESPELATSLGLTEAEAGGPYNDKLGDASIAGSDRMAATIAAFAKRLDAIDESLLSDADRVTHDVMADSFRFAAAGVGFGYGWWGGLGAPTPYAISQLSGAYASVPDFLASTHPLKTLKDAQDYVARVRAFATVIDQETARLTDDAEKDKVFPPLFAIDKTIAQISPLAQTPAPQTGIVLSLRDRAVKAGLAPVQLVPLVEEATTLMRDSVQPALRRQMAALAALRPQATNDIGAWRLPRGEAFYAAALKAWTTLDMTPEQIHQMGLDLVASLTAEMDADLKAMGLTEGTVAERVQALGRRPDQIIPSTPEGRARALTELNDQMGVITKRMPEMFGVLAKQPLEIKRVPPEIETGAPGGYYQAPSLDGSRPGYYYINLRNPATEWPRFTLPTLTYHEGTPGHHWQISIAQENKDMPLLRRGILWFSGYGEGWALYAEQIADELGMYKTDPAGRIGYLQSMIFRAARLVVDTGMHAKKWSRDQAIDYMVSVTGDQRTSIETEVERYAVWPGQACAYMPGRVVINRLRDKARKELGDRFDIRAFHDLLLTPGARPLSVMERDVDGWISQTKAAPQKAPG